MSLPESWVETKVGKVIVDLQPGFAQKPGEDDEGMMPQVRTHNVSPEGRITLEGIKHVSASIKEMERYKLAIGDVVFNNTNSEEWVGKTAVFNQEGEFVFSNHMTRLRVDSSLINPDYLASYLHLLWSMGYSKTRAKRWVSQAGIEGAALASFKLPLPTLPEQKRIVDVLRQAEVVAKAKRSISEQIDQLVRTLYWKYFGDWYTADGLRDPVRISEYVDGSQYGVSEAMGESGSHAVLRMNSITTSGWLDLSDLKYASLSKKDADSTTLQSGDLLFNRTNSKELVGKCAIWRGAEGIFSFASYLIRLRLKDGMLPEYLWATLNSAYGKYRLMNSAKQAVSMANVSPTDLGRITVPLPPLKLQEDFARLVRQIEALRMEMLTKVASFEELQNMVTQQALTGEATAAWREKHRREIKDAAAIRDVALGKHAAKTSVQITETAPAESTTKTPRPARLWLINELSEFQHEIWNTLRYEWRGSVIVDDPEVFGDFCTSPQTAWRIEHFKASPSRIRRTLEQLAALGLIAKVSVPKLNTLTLQNEYLTAFRPLREEENTRLADAGLMRRALSPESSGANE